MMRLTFPIPDPIHGANLTTELRAALGIEVDDPYIVDGTLVIIVPDGTDENLVRSVVEAHTGLPTTDQILEIEAARATRPLTGAEYATVRAQMQTLRDLRQMGRNAFMALTAAERDRLMYDAFTATTQVLLSILRDE